MQNEKRVWRGCGKASGCSTAAHAVLAAASQSETNTKKGAVKASKLKDRGRYLCRVVGDTISGWLICVGSMLTAKLGSSLFDADLSKTDLLIVGVCGVAFAAYQATRQARRDRDVMTMGLSAVCRVLTSTTEELAKSGGAESHHTASRDGSPKSS